MDKKNRVSASIVLFNEDFDILKQTIDCFLKIALPKKLFLIDNTVRSLFKDQFKHPDIEYISSGKNIGFGAGHNAIIERIKDQSSFHLVLNPDVLFQPEVISTLMVKLEQDSQLAMIAPKVLFPNGDYQFSCRRYPRLKELLGRRFGFLKPFFKKIIFKGQYQDVDLKNAFYAEYITGCFHLYKTADFVALKGFDERYFLYMEDVDICKKIDAAGKKKMYDPEVEIKHVLKKGSSKNIALFFRHSFSAIKYFLKWGF